MLGNKQFTLQRKTCAHACMHVCVCAAYIYLWHFPPPMFYYYYAKKLSPSHQGILWGFSGLLSQVISLNFNRFPWQSTLNFIMEIYSKNHWHYKCLSRYLSITQRMRYRYNETNRFLPFIFMKVYTSMNDMLYECSFSRTNSSMGHMVIKLWMVIPILTVG